MKRTLRVLMLMVCCLLAVSLNLPANAQADSLNKACSQPLVLGLIPSDNGRVKYEISGQVYAGYPLDDLRRLLSRCKVPRSLYVVIDSRVPIGQISSAVAPKLQADNVRYFIKYPTTEHLIIEVKINDYLSKLP